MPDRSLYVRWVVACAAAELIGIGAAAAMALAVRSAIGAPATTGARLAVLVAMACAGAIEGGALGWLQWRVLRLRLPRLRAGEWVGVTVAIAVIGWIAGMSAALSGGDAGSGPAGSEPSLALVLLMSGAAGGAAGALFGAGQWLVLRRHARHAGRWVAIHVPGWAAAMAAIFLGASLPSASWPPWAIAASGAVAGLVGGALLGAITGLTARSLAPWVDERGWSLRGKVCAVTGANAGIGLEVATGLARMGGTVLLLCRDERRGADARRAIAATTGTEDVHVVRCDLASLDSVRAAASAVRAGWDRLDVLVHNAGGAFPARELTGDGIEATLAVDVVGPFLLTALLRDRLEAARGRVVTVAGIYHRRGRIDLDDLGYHRRPYRWLAASNGAQLGRVLVTAELARRSPRVTAVAVHPGGVLTRGQQRLPLAIRVLIHTLLRPGFVRAEIGAAPVLRLAADPDVRGVSGRFFDRFRAAPDAPDPALAAAFWKALEALTGEDRAEVA
jgi:NAD(P)-dependent dehydrogenase (short-subunit alcohol dehydrogenase family)